MKARITILAALMLASSAATVAADGEPPSTGLSILVDAGAFWASKNNANFYSGREGNVNTIYRVLHSNTYGKQIYDYLSTMNYITDAVQNERQLTVAEWPEMYYRTSFQVGMGLKYQYRSGLGWLLRFDLTRLNARGVFNLSADNGTGIPGGRQYVPFNIVGLEDRINIDLAITEQVPLNRTTSLEVDLGASLINTKVRDNIIEIDRRTWSILDRWNGQSPDAGVAPYDQEILQGGIGYGVFMSLLIGYQIPSIGALKAGYTCYQSKTVLRGGTGADGSRDPYTAWGWQHMLGIRVEMNNFSFLNNK